MRILILSHMYPRSHHPAGGIFVHEQVRALRARGVDARVVSGDPFWVQTVNPKRIMTALCAYGAYVPVWTQQDTVPVLHFPYLCGYLFRPSVHAITYVHGLKRILAAACNGFSFDIIHAHTSFLDGSAGMEVRRVTRRPLVITEHMGPFGILTRNALMWRITRRAVVGADHVIAVSPSLRQDMAATLRLDPQAIEVLPNGVDTEVFHPAGNGRREPDGVTRALWVGHHVAIKGIDRLLRAFARACRVRPELRLSLLGDGPKRGAMEDLARELGLAAHVTFHPAADRAGVAAAMRAHDFLVVSSLKETFSLVALEALACGIPVLSTACGGPEALITDPLLGLVVSNDVNGLARGLLAILTRIDATDPRRLQEHVSRYAWPSIADELVTRYRAVLAPSIRHAAESISRKSGHRFSEGKCDKHSF